MNKDNEKDEGNQKIFRDHMSAISLVKLIPQFIVQQKATIQEMCFGGLLECKVEKVPTQTRRVAN